MRTRPVFYAASDTNYFGIDNDTRTDLTVDQIFAELPAGLQAEKNQEMYFGSWCRYYKLKNIAYEGGPALVEDASLDAKIAANRDARMKDVIVDNINNWYEIELSMYEVLAQPRPPLTAGIAVPGTLTYSQAVDHWGAFFVEAENYWGMGVGDWINFLIRVPASGNYRLRGRAQTDVGATLNATLNSDQVASWDVVSTTWADLPWMSISLEAGLNVLRVAPVTGDLDLNSLSIEFASRENTP